MKPETILQALAQTRPALLDEARETRKKRSAASYCLRPLAGLAAAFALFVLLINLSPSVAKACEGVPFLASLTRSLRISDSLVEAVENDYYQRVDQQQTIDGVTVTVDYMIMDEKSLTVFYRDDQPEGSNLLVCPCQDDQLAGAAYYDDIQDPNYQGHVFSMIYYGSVPENVQMQFALLDSEGEETGKVFTFQLEPDPRFMAETRHIDSDQVLELDGQRVRITGVDIYPSMMSFTMEAGAEATAIPSLDDYYVLTDDGTRYEKLLCFDGTMTFDHDNPERFWIYTESPYFQNPSSITLCVGEDTYWSYKWQEKGATSIHFHPSDGTATGLPPDIEIVDYSRQENGDWHLALRTRNTARELLFGGFSLDMEPYWRTVEDENPDPNVVEFTTYSVDTDDAMLWLDYRLHSDQPFTATFELNPSK